ncbi:pseudouridine synthase [Hominiventricola aquisgranensis]|uniref:Pseudouridine synthase n=1 Tax=Hominiventricola aquisgranensis TaxID=3133164 RepID=A0ABV1I0K6_9FIRM|nr:rRNA pseudouridine synthase [Clostridiaceae bacterium AF42-6]RHP52047.1 rRNA pseudouridine synthase [Clostridiaceae bacterium AF31-3BH]RHQ25056.1 rRNA pseudouridine synthase [Clostridiaceae bacterium AF29-16BH]
MMRLDKYLCETGFGTRSQVKDLLKKGQVMVNGEVVKKPELKINETTDQILCQGKKASYQKNIYLMLHKPAGVVSATEDNREKTVLDLVRPEDRKNGLFPVGRLDKDTEGLLLLTDDGELAHRLLSPKKHVDKTYYAKIDGQVTEEHVKQFREGLDIGDEKKTLPAVLTILLSGPVSEIEVTIHEGRFHQIKRMFEAVGCKVTYLKRLSMGSLVLDETLPPEEYRPLTEAELEGLTKQRGTDKNE